MSVDIRLDELPEWDMSVNGHMKEIFRDPERFPRIVKLHHPIGSMDNVGEESIRPSDFSKWRTELNRLEDEPFDDDDMWMKAMDFLEANPDKWFYVVY